MIGPLSNTSLPPTSTTTNMHRTYSATSGPKKRCKQWCKKRLWKFCQKSLYFEDILSRKPAFLTEDQVRREAYKKLRMDQVEFSAPKAVATTSAATTSASKEESMIDY